MKDGVNSNNTYSTLEIYKNIIENANDIILLLDTSGNIIDANKQAIESYGYSYNELTSIDIFQIRDASKLERAKIQFEEAKTNGIEFETTHYRKDHTSFPVEVKSIGLSYGSRYYVASIIRDISRRKKKEEEIRALASIVESFQDAIFGTSSDGTITSWNKGAENLFLYSKAETLGRHASILVPKSSSDNINNIIKTVKSNGKLIHYETQRMRKDGKLIHISASVSPIYDFEGNFTGISAIMRDLTERYNLTKQINEQEQRWKVANELILGNTFQASLMANTRNFGLVRMFGKYVPSSMVGGDLYDCTVINGSIWFIIADVTGHGLVAAMLSTMIKGLFNNCIQTCQFPHEVLENMNSILCKTLTDFDSYLISAFIGVIRKDNLYFSNAGHPYPVLINCPHNKLIPLEQNGYLLAMQQESQYHTLQTSVSPGDQILLYTDGLFNLRKKNSSNFWERISDYSLQNLKLLSDNPQAYIENLIHSFSLEFDEGYDDDVSVMMINVN